MISYQNLIMNENFSFVFLYQIPRISPEKKEIIITYRIHISDDNDDDDSKCCQFPQNIWLIWIINVFCQSVSQSSFDSKKKITTKENRKLKSISKWICCLEIFWKFSKMTSNKMIIWDMTLYYYWSKKHFIMSTKHKNQPRHSMTYFILLFLFLFLIEFWVGLNFRKFFFVLFWCLIEKLPRKHRNTETKKNQST